MKRENVLTIVLTVSALTCAAEVVSFKDAAKIRSWDAWKDHEAKAVPKERRCVTMEKLNALDCGGLREIGRLRTRESGEIRDSGFSVGCETMDRDYADWNAYKHLLPTLGVKHARFFSGWAKTEQEKGVYDFAWLDPHIRECAAMGIKPWICVSYGNPVWGSDFRLGMRVKQVTGNPEAFAAWLRYARALVLRYGDVVDEWEIWNEPFDQGEEYAELFYRTAKAIREVQPKAKCYCTAVAFPKDYKCVLEKLKREGALDLGSYFIYHPYAANPDTSYDIDGQGQMTSQPALPLRKLVKAYDARFDIMQGEVGCPSQLEFAHALKNLEWTEYSQAKWNLRRAVGDAVRSIPSNVFTMIDLQYTFMLQSFGLVRSNALKEFVYRRPSFFAMRNVFNVLDDGVKPVSVAETPCDGRRLTTARFVRGGAVLTFLWYSDAMPSNDLSFDSRTVEIEGEVPDPVWVEMITGRVFGIPSDRVVCRNGRTTVRGLPVWDSPVLVVSRAGLAVDLLK